MPTFTYIKSTNSTVIIYSTQVNVATPIKQSTELLELFLGADHHYSLIYYVNYLSIHIINCL